MPVQVQVPNGFRADKQADPIERLANALNVAKNIYGIYHDSQTLDIARQQKEEQSKKTALESDVLKSQLNGEVTPKDLLDKGIQSYSETPQEGYVPVLLRGADELDTPLRVYIKPKSGEGPLAELGKTLDIQGKKLDIKKKEKELAEAKDSPQDKHAQWVQQQIEQMRGNPAIQQAERDLYAADKAKSLVNLYGDPDKLSPQMVKLLYSEVGKIAQGGSPTVEELKGLDPSALSGRLSGIWQKFSNQPTSANAAAFVNQYMDYANQVSKDAQKVITDRYGRILNSNKRQMGDANYNVLKSTYLDRFNQPAEGPSLAGQSKEDEQAIAWAQKNPSDPRAVKILQLHGIDKGTASR